MDYEYYYNNAKNRYYDACSEINYSENRIEQFKSERQHQLNRVNEINSEIVRYNDALEQLEQALKKDTGLHDECNEIKKAIDNASYNFSGMAQSSNINKKNLNDLYNDDTSAKLTNVFSDIRVKKNNICNKINELENDKRNAENEFNEAKSGMDNETWNLQQWRNSRNNASIDMEYYKKKMDEEQ